MDIADANFGYVCTNTCLSMLCTWLRVVYQLRAVENHVVNCKYFLRPRSRQQQKKVAMTLAIETTSSYFQLSLHQRKECIVYQAVCFIKSEQTVDFKKETLPVELDAHDWSRQIEGKLCAVLELLIYSFPACVTSSFYKLLRGVIHPRFYCKPLLYC